MHFVETLQTSHGLFLKLIIWPQAFCFGLLVTDSFNSRLVLQTTLLVPTSCLVQCFVRTALKVETHKTFNHSSKRYNFLWKWTASFMAKALHIICMKQPVSSSPV